MKISKYTLTDNLIILGRLFLKNDEIFIEDVIDGKLQMVFLTDRTLIGSIKSETYWILYKNLKALN